MIVYMQLVTLVNTILLLQMKRFPTIVEEYYDWEFHYVCIYTYICTVFNSRCDDNWWFYAKNRTFCATWLLFDSFQFTSIYSLFICHFNAVLFFLFLIYFHFKWSIVKGKLPTCINKRQKLSHTNSFNSRLFLALFVDV
jgi:hypothetical protein